jgi:hypothetical protein
MSSGNVVDQQPKIDSPFSFKGLVKKSEDTSSKRCCYKCVRCSGSFKICCLIDTGASKANLFCGMSRYMPGIEAIVRLYEDDQQSACSCISLINACTCDAVTAMYENYKEVEGTDVMGRLRMRIARLENIVWELSKRDGVISKAMREKPEGAADAGVRIDDNDTMAAIVEKSMRILVHPKKGGLGPWFDYEKKLYGKPTVNTKE